MTVHGSGRVRFVIFLVGEGCLGSLAFMQRGWDPHVHKPREIIRQALTGFGWIWFITRRLRCPVLGECRRGIRYFWSR